jgi:hypothetical protein
MISLVIGCGTAKRGKWGSLGSIGVTHEGKGTCLTILKSMLHDIASLFLKIWDVTPIIQRKVYKKIS